MVKEVGRDAALRQKLSEIVHDCRLSRGEICEALSGRVGVKITPFMLDCYTSRTKRHRFPAFLVADFCEVIGSDELVRFVMGPRLRELVELGERVRSMGWVLEKIKAEVAILAGEARRNKAKGKERGKR